MLPEPPATPPSRASIRRVAGIVVGVMGVMAILSFAFAWNTVAWRRSRDPKPPRVLATPQAVARPIELAALGYLPADPAVVEADMRGEAVFDTAPGLVEEVQVIVDRLGRN